MSEKLARRILGAIGIVFAIACVGIIIWATINVWQIGVAILGGGSLGLVFFYLLDRANL